MELRCQYDLGIMLNHMNLARSSYYYYEKKHQRDDKYKDIKKLIQHIYDKHKGRFGYRRITLEIKNRGILINHKTVLRLMKYLGLKSLIRVKKYKSYQGQQGKIAPNVLKRNFKTTMPMKNGQQMLQNLMS